MYLLFKKCYNHKGPGAEYELLTGVAITFKGVGLMLIGMTDNAQRVG